MSAAVRAVIFSGVCFGAVHPLLHDLRVAVALQAVALKYFFDTLGVVALLAAIAMVRNYYC